MTEKLVDINLSVNINENRMIAHLSISNNKVERIFLDKLTICYGNKIQNNLFKVLDKNSNRIDYKGVMLKRDITPDDFVAIEPGEKIEMRIALDEFYKVVKGNAYSIQYYAYNPSYKDVSGFIKLESNIVEVQYK
jgi:hypothetical protein